MARPREFDMEDAVEGAMQIFWRQGYAATNLPDLLSAMGLSRGSFYKAFGNKRSVYIAALKRYERIYIGNAVRLLEDSSAGDGRARIDALFKGAFARPQAGEPRRGCFVCNAMVELAPSDGEVARLTVQMCERLQQAVRRALDASRLPPDGDGAADRQALLITNIYFGAQAISKSGGGISDWVSSLNMITGG